MDCTVSGVAKSWTRQSELHFHFLLEGGLTPSEISKDHPGRIQRMELRARLEERPVRWPVTWQHGQVPRSGTRLHWEIVLKREDQGDGLARCLERYRSGGDSIWGQGGE